MPFFNDAPLDPDLNLKGDIGPGLDNRLDDQVKLASAIEKKTGAAPHADLGAFGESLANSFTKGSGAKRNNGLTPGFLGATIAAQVKRGTDTDGVVLKDGPTRDALINKENLPAGGSLFAPLPAVKQPVGPCQPNRPADLRTLQGKLATIGRLPRVTEKPLFPQKPDTIANAGAAAKGLRTLLDGVRAFQQAKGLKQDSRVNPGGPTEQAIDAQTEKARKAKLERFTTLSKHVLDSDEPKFRDITNRNAAESMAGLIVGKEVQEQQSSSEEKNFKINSEGYPPLATISAGPITTDIKRDGGPEFEIKTVQFTQNRERTSPRLSREKSKETGDSKSEKPSSSRLVLKTKEERRKSIISNSEGTIYVKKNPKADGDEPLHAIHAAGRAAVEVFDKIIEAEARKQGVDPNLVRAIVYVENAQGWYAKPFEGFGTKPFKGLGPLEKLGVKTYFPMNIHVEFWAPLGFRGKNYLRAQTNVHVGVKLIKRIAERLDRPTIAKIATLYNSISKDSVTDYGARVARVYRDRSWQKRD